MFASWVLLAGMLVGLMPAPAQAAPAAQPCPPVIVTSAADSGPGSLRQAVEDACDGGTITFAPELAGQTITFASQIMLSKDVTIAATDPVILSGNNAARLFEISPSRTVSLSGLTLINGNPGASEGGGAISNNGALTISDSTFANNTAEMGGGAIYNNAGGTVTVDRSGFRDNTAGGGGGIANFGTVTVSASSFIGNTADNGGAIQNGADLTVEDSTFSGNTATTSGGGAIYNANSMTLALTHSTLSANTAPYGGGVFSYGAVTLTAVVFSANTATQDSGSANCFAGVPITSAGYNVVSDDTCSLGGTNDRNNAGPQTRDVQPNGTAPLLANAIAVGNVTDAALCAGDDQLGNTRQPAPCDAGAAEFVYWLTVATAGSGSGVTTPPAGVHAYRSGEQATVTATPGANSTFTGWSGACSGGGACTITMNADQTVTANFTLKSYSLAVTKTGSGVVASSPDGINCGSACTASFLHGTAVTLTPTPATGYNFASWSGACMGSSACTVTMDAAKSVTANFTLKSYSLEVTKAGSGSVASSPPGIDCGSTCTASFTHSMLVTLTPTPATGYSFTAWTGACSGSVACSVMMDGAKSVGATFTINTYPITYNANGATGGTAPAPQVKTHDVPLTLQTNSGGLVKAGQAFIGWNTQPDGGGTDYAAGATYTANAPLTLYAKWACHVRTTADSGAGSLRQAVLDAASGDTLCFAPGLAGQTIAFGSQIVIDKSITISGTVPVALSGNSATRLFEIKPGFTVSLYGLTLRDGKAEKGGAIYSQDANLWVVNSAILNNVAQAGGGIYLVDSAKSHMSSIQNSTLAGNRAEAPSGGKAAAAAPGLPLVGVLGLGSVLGIVGVQGGAQGRKRRCVLAPFLGLAIFVLLVGAACNIGVSTNSGGAIYVESGSVSIDFSTLAYNSAGEGAAIFNQINSTDKGPVNGGWVLVSHSVLSQNTGTACNFNPATFSGGFNAVSDASCNFAGEDDRNSAGAQVQALQANGAAPLLPESAAVELVPNDCLNIDQLGNARPAIYCAAGAVEFQGQVKARLHASLRAGLGTAFQGDKYDYTVTVENGGRGEATGLQVSLPLPAGLAYDTAPTWTDGAACTWAAPTLRCTTPLGSGGVLVLTVPVKLTTAAAEGAQLETTATAQAAAPASPSTASLVVTSMGPVPPTVGEGHTYRTIQEAVNAVPAGTTILVFPGTYVENVTVAKNVTIRGVEGAARTIVDGDQKGRVFTINAGVVTLDGLTVRNGGNTENGGGIWNDGVLTVNRSVVRGNTATNFGGGIYNLVQLTINDTVIEGNTATKWGGGIFNSESTPLAINDTVIESNTSKGDGGGLMNYGNATISNTIFSRNTALQRGGGYISMIGTTIIVINSTVAFNEAKMGGGSYHWSATETVRNSIFWGNKGAGSPDIYVISKGTLAISNSLLQARGDGVESRKNIDPLFVGEPGDLHLRANSPARSFGRNCLSADRDGKGRATDVCSAGAYEFQAATEGGGGMAAVEAAAEQADFTFASNDGAVTLDIPAGAMTQTVHLAFSLGGPTGGDGRTRSVVFTPYNAAGAPLAQNFGFLQPATLTLAYDPLLVNRGLDIDLLPMRFEPLTGSWLPFTRDVAVDQAARTVMFPITQAGEYGLFSMPPGVYASLAAYSPAGTANLDGGAPVNYALTVFNNSWQPLQNLALAHSLPPGLAFTGWVQANGAAFDNGALTWNIPMLPGGGVQAAIFSAQVSGDATFQGKAITSTVTLAGPGGLSASGETVVSVNGPPTAVDDSATTRPGEAITLWPLLNDLNPDGSPLRLAGLGSPANGSAAIVRDTVVYTPTAGFEGTDAFTYQVQDGLFNVEGTIRMRAARLAFLGVMQTVSHNGQSGMSLTDVPQNSTVEYRLDLYNSDGGEIGQNVVLTNALPDGVQFTGWITQSGAVLDGGTIRWSAGSVPTNTVTTISFRAQVVAAPGEVITNTVTAAAANADETSASTMVAVGGTPEPLHLYLPLLQLEAGPAADAGAAAPVDAEAAIPAWEDALAPEHIFLPEVAQ